MKKKDIKKQIAFGLVCFVLATLIEINCFPHVQNVNYDYENIIGSLENGALLPWIRIAIVTFLLFIIGAFGKFVYRVCMEKGLIDKIRTNNRYRNIFAGSVSILFALIYNAIFIQPYGRNIYSISTRSLVILIATCIYLLYLLIAYMYKMHLEKSIDTKCANRAIAINAIFIYIVIAGALIFCADDMQRSGFWKSDLIGTSYVGMNDLSGESSDYEITGIDPYVIYEIEDYVYDRGIIFFDEIAYSDTKFGIFYSSIMDTFSEERKVSCIQKEGTDYAAFQLPDNYQIHYIRVDYEGIDGNIIIGDAYHIESVYATKDNVLTKLHGKLTIQTYLNLLCLTAIFAVLLFNLYRRETLWDKYYNTKVRVAVEIIMIFVLPAVLFWKYISGQAYFLFPDSASDSIEQYYPQLLHIADRVKNGQWTEMFSFIIGLGNKENSIILGLQNWPAMFGRANVAYLMGISIFLKVVLSGLFTYGLVGLWGIKDEKRVVITLGYEFNAMLTIRSYWVAYPNVALMIIFWLYCFELAYRKRQNRFYLLFAFASELFFLQFDLYYCILYGFIFLVYIFCRVLSDGNGIKLAFKYSFLNYGVFALLGSADSFMLSFIDKVSSSRVSNVYAETTDHIFDLLKFQWGMLYEAFIRSIGQAISGLFGDFVGSANVLEGPAFYFGIFMLIIIPVAYYNLPKKKRILFALGLLASFLFITVGIVRVLAAGFAGSSFKYSSFWITVLGILIILEAFSNIKESGYKKNSLLVFNITAAICFLLIISILFSDRVSRVNQWWFSLIYFLIYVVIVNLFYVYNVKAVRWVLILVVMTEGVVLSYDGLNNRTTCTTADLNERFYDDTYEAIQEISSHDKNWYRIEKSPGLACDSYVQGYYGTASYVGGSLIGSGIQNYYRELGLPSQEGMRYLSGTAGNLYANSLLGVKYIFLNGIDNTRYGIQYIASKGDVNIYENTLALPIGYFYDETISIDEFGKLSYWDRNRVLLERALCTTANSKFDEMVVKEAPDFDGEGIQYKFTSSKEHMDVSEIDGLLVLDIQFKSEEDKPTYGNIFWSDSDEKDNSQILSPAGVVEVCADDISSIWFDRSMSEKIDCVNVYAYDADEYYAKTVSAIRKLQTNGMQVINITDYEINGTIAAASNGVLATSIPYDTNWEIYVDGVKTQLLEVNTGFIGTEISAGNHDIRIYYKHESWIGNNKFKCAGMVILLILSIYTHWVSRQDKLRKLQKC